MKYLYIKDDTMQYFYINQGSVNPPLRVDLILDGRYDFMKSALYNNAIQNASVTFSMYDENDILTVSKGVCNLVLVDEDSCDERYVIEYKWQKRDTKKTGKFRGKFEIIFNEGLKIEDMENEPLPSGNLIMPIYEDLIIMVK